MEEESPPPPPLQNNVEMHDDEEHGINNKHAISSTHILGNDQGNSETSNILRLSNKVSSLSFREVISKSTQWFEEAKKIGYLQNSRMRRTKT